MKPSSGWSMLVNPTRLDNPGVPVPDCHRRAGQTPPIANTMILHRQMLPAVARENGTTVAVKPHASPKVQRSADLMLDRI